MANLLVFGLRFLCLKVYIFDMKLSGVRLSHPAADLLLRARLAEDIYRLLHGRRSAANASSVTLSADARS